MEDEVLWCGGALLVTLSVIYLEFKAHLTSMAATAFCSDTVRIYSTLKVGKQVQGQNTFN